MLLHILTVHLKHVFNLRFLVLSVIYSRQSCITDWLLYRASDGTVFNVWQLLFE